MKEYFWVEKYRPREFEDVIGVPEQIVNSVSNGKIRHLLLTGTAGTGKTTTAKIIINKIAPNDKLILNASKDRGIDIIRDKVGSFAMTSSSNGNLKIVFLDEADYLTKDAQASLRNLMEEYSRTCIFILTGNEEQKILDALKSRCSHYKFVLPKKEEIKERLKYIVNEENVNINDDNLDLLVNKYYPDIRNSINILQSLNELNKEITSDMINIENNQVEQIFNLINNGKSWKEVRQWILDNNILFNQIIVKMVEYTYKSNLSNKVKILLLLKDTNRYLNICANPEVEFSLTILQIMNLVKEK